MIPAPTPPSGESAPPSLEERELVEILATEAEDLGIHIATASVTQRDVDAVQEAREAVFAEFARLRAEVARLTAELEDHGPDGRNVTNAQHQAMRERALAAEARAARAEEEARRYRETLVKIDDDAAHWLANEPIGQPNPYARAIDAACRRALTEGADRHA